MTYAALGIVIGIVVLMGQPAPVAAVADRIVEAVLGVAFTVGESATGALTGTVPHDTVAVVAGGLARAALPGLVAILLVVAAHAGLRLRRALAALVLVLGVGVLVVEGMTAWPAVATLALLALLAGVVGGFIATVPALAAAVVLAGRSVADLLDSGGSQQARDSLAPYISDPGMMQAVLVVAALAPFLIAARVFMRLR